jgi:hypothetical protein
LAQRPINTRNRRIKFEGNLKPKEVEIVLINSELITAKMPKIKKVSYVTIVVVLINFLLKSLNILMAQKASTSTAKN